MKKHTQGEWKVVERGKVSANARNRFVIHAPAENIPDIMIEVGTCGYKPHAQLFAAAPRLLEALEGLLSDIEEYQRINNLGGENNHWQVRARAAIAAAKGE